jgi:uncharacterized protein YyaL (SSP411 family)
VANRLADETSPYLLQHAGNPVDWRPWGEEALAAARQDDRPIFLSIGYAACHWCHVMAHESFEDPATAALLNTYFVPIKVDREERPDLDAVYMEAVTALTGHGGWPMSVFLTPEGQPFYGGTYFPPLRRYGMPAFSEVLQSIAAGWQTDRERLVRGASALTDAMRRAGRPQAGPAREDDEALLDDAVTRLLRTEDATNGGWGEAPKFPQPMILEFLLRRYTVTDDEGILRVVTHALDAMAAGGIHDQLGGGFHRYATDAFWLVPHFEKMLYDNAQLARVYLHAWQTTGHEPYRRVATDILDYVSREMTDPAGGFYASQDADSEGREGAFFVWTPEEVRAALAEDGAENDVDLVMAAYGVTGRGNFEGRSILSLAMTPEELATGRGRDAEEVARRLDAARARLFGARERRVRPARDEKVLTAWNGLMLAAFAEAARVLGRDDYRRAAERNAAFVLEHLRTPDGRLLRTWKDGSPKLNGYLEDYADYADGLLELYQATFDELWFVAARDLAEHILAHFAAPDGGFFDTSDDHETLVVRPRYEQDNALPSGGAAAASVLLRLAAYTGQGRYRDAAEASLAPLRSLLIAHPTAFAHWLTALDLATAAVDEVALVTVGDGEEGTTLDAFLTVLSGEYRPHLVVATGIAATPSQVPLLQDREPLDRATTAYVCHAFTCRQPLTDPAALARQLRRQSEAKVRVMRDRTMDDG